MIAALKHAAFAVMPVKQRFRRIHRLSQAYWKSTESVSGLGSTLANTENIRRELPGLLRRHGVRTIVDVPCGDFNWMRHVITPAGIESYTGLDIVPEIIETNRTRYGSDHVRFAQFDVIREVPPTADLVLMRDLLIHFSFADARRALQNVRRSGATYLLATTYAEVSENADIVTGRWRPINLTLAPYGFPEPLELIRENEGRGKSLCLWRATEG
jgi:hypothetical protein